ncbi:hypothetical protein D3C81_2189120 [compost metagenome]
MNDTGASALGHTDRPQFSSAVIVWIGIVVMCGAAFCDGLVRTAASPAGVTVAAS